MNTTTYNLGLLLGTAGISTGAGLQWGLPAALLAGGALVIALTLTGAAMTARKAP